MTQIDRLFTPNYDKLHEQRRNGVRPMRPDELNFVLATWTNSHGFMLHKSQRSQRIPEFRRNYVYPVLETKPLIVVWETNGTLHGWACAAPGQRLFYAYLPKDLRGRGLSRPLVEAALGSYPDRIATAYPWPYATPRFTFTPWKRAAA